MKDITYEIRSSLWSPQFGTISSGEGLKVIGCYSLGRSTRILLQDRTGHVALFEIGGILRTAGLTYLAIVLPEDFSGESSATPCSVTFLEILSPKDLVIPAPEQFQTLNDSVNLVEFLNNQDQAQSQLDLLRENFLVADEISKLRFTFKELEEQGIYLNPYGHSASFGTYSYRIVFKWREETSTFLVLTPSEPLEHHQAVELELSKVFVCGSQKYCIFTHTHVERAEEGRPFSVVLKRQNGDEFVSISTAEAASISEGMIASLYTGLQPSEQDIEACLGQLRESPPLRSDVEMLTGFPSPA